MASRRNNERTPGLDHFVQYHHLAIPSDPASLTVVIELDPPAKVPASALYGQNSDVGTVQTWTLDRRRFCRSPSRDRMSALVDPLPRSITWPLGVSKGRHATALAASTPTGARLLGSRAGSPKPRGCGAQGRANPASLYRVGRCRAPSRNPTQNPRFGGEELPFAPAGTGSDHQVDAGSATENLALA
jgi:hypothetical protein